MMEECLECGKPAKHVRRTQFAGDHPYCGLCGPKEKDFGQQDNNTRWTTLPTPPSPPA